jgi:hypothetical protein
VRALRGADTHGIKIGDGSPSHLNETIQELFVLSISIFMGTKSTSSSLSSSNRVVPYEQSEIEAPLPSLKSNKWGQRGAFGEVAAITTVVADMGRWMGSRSPSRFISIFSLPTMTVK